MAARDSIGYQIRTAIQTSLEAIVAGDTYHLTPGTIVRTIFYTPGLLDSSVDQPIYAIRPGEHRHFEETTGQCRGEMETFILLLHSYDYPDTPFEPAEQTEEELVEAMVQDVIGKLVQDVQLLNQSITPAGAVENIFQDGDPISVNYDQPLKSWAVAEIRFTTSYQYDSGEP